MENKGNLPVKRQEKLLQDIEQLQLQITAVKSKIETLENQEKVEHYKNNFLGVRKNDLKRSIEFYGSFSKKINSKLAEKLATHVKCTMANECYDKLLEVYRDKYLQYKNYNNGEENSLLEAKLSFEKHITDLLREKDELESVVQVNSTIVKGLLQELHFDKEQNTV